MSIAPMTPNIAGSGPRKSARFAFHASGAGPLLRNVWPHHR